MSTTRMRLERLGDERARLYEKIEETVKLAEDEQRDPNELEHQHLSNWRTRTVELEEEINILAGDLERAEGALDVSQRLRQKPPEPEEGDGDGGGSHHYRTFAAHARDVLITRYPLIATQTFSDAGGGYSALRGRARSAAARQNTLTADVGPPAAAIHHRDRPDQQEQAGRRGRTGGPARPRQADLLPDRAAAAGREAGR
jgi:hypothetical protein